MGARKRLDQSSSSELEQLIFQDRPSLRRNYGEWSLKLSQVKTIERNNRGGKREPGDLRKQAIIKKKKNMAQNQ